MGMRTNTKNGLNQIISMFDLDNYQVFAKLDNGTLKAIDTVELLGNIFFSEAKEISLHFRKIVPINTITINMS